MLSPFFYKINRMRVTKARNPRVLKVVKMPRFMGVVTSMIKFEEKIIKKKTVMVRIPAPRGGDCKYVMTRFIP